MIKPVNISQTVSPNKLKPENLGLAENIHPFINIVTKSNLEKCKNFMEDFIMKNTSKMIKILFFSILFLPFKSIAAPDPDIYGWKYTFSTHEGAYYNGNKIYEDIIHSSHSGTERYLNKISRERNHAIDTPIKEKIRTLVYDAANEVGASVRSFSSGVNGRLKLSFSPNSSRPSTLDFTIDGIDIKTTTSIEKIWYAEGILGVDINRLVIKGTLDYFHGEVNVTSVTGDIDYDVDLDFSIPVINVVIDPLLDYFVDMQVAELPTSLTEFYSVDALPSASLMGISDMIPDGKLIYNGMDYGPILREKILYEDIIGDNIAVTIGNVVVFDQYFELLIGNLTYKRWVTHTRTICRLSPEDDYCLPI